MIAVVHLVWGPLGHAPLRRFLASYRAHSAGIDHDLVILLNGVAGDQLSAVMDELEGQECEIITTSRPVQDLAAYAEAASRLRHDRLCFVNSHVEILAGEWLSKLSSTLDQPGAGLVGATGAWTSMASLALHLNRMPSPYRQTMPPRPVARAQLRELDRQMQPPASGPGGARPLGSMPAHAMDALGSVRILCEQLIRFEPFPNHHLRTNGFMARRDVFDRLRVGGLRRKIDAHALESGRNSFTRQVERLGMKALVVDRAGDAYSHAEWPQSRTFWQDSQEDLMLADNQTRLYSEGAAPSRCILSTMAWGSHSAVLRNREPRDP